MDKPSSSRKSRAKTAPPQTPPADEPLAFDDDGLKRVQDIIRNARATWFALLGALVFASVTLASVKDVAFFVSSVETKLPLVGISVPIVSFFWAGSLLIAALYAYFHLYLELLWQALGDAPARINGKPLADRIEPWIVADTALRLRDRLRGALEFEESGRKRAMQTVSDMVSFSLVWLYGLVVIGWFWWRSMPKHEPLFTGFMGLVFAFTLWIFLSGIWSAWANLAGRQPSWRWRSVFLLALLGVFCTTIVRTGKYPIEDEWRNAFVFASLCQSPDQEETEDSAPAENASQGKSAVDETETQKLPFYCWRNSELMDTILYPAPADLREVVFVEKPKDWQGKAIAEAEFRIRWCKERGEPKCANPLALENQKFDEPEERAFQAAWKERWAALLVTFSKPDLRDADLRRAYLFSASLEGAILTGANLDSAELNFANLDGAVLQGAHLRNAALVDTNLFGSDLSNANLDSATLFGTNLRTANLNSADLSAAILNDTDLKGAILDNANMFGARLMGSDESKIELRYTSLDDADFYFTAMSNVDLNGVDIKSLRNFASTFGDSSVKLPDSLSWPCQWGREGEGNLDDAQFFGRWRGWSQPHLKRISSIQMGFATPLFTDPNLYPIIQPPAGCLIQPQEPHVLPDIAY